MQILKFFTVVLVLFGISCSNTGNPEQFYYPADFNLTHSTGFIWTTDFNEVIPELIGIITKKDKVTLYFEQGQDLSEMDSILQNYGANTDNINFSSIKEWPKNAWIRDFGPCYIVNNLGDKKIVDFSYYGNRFSFNKNVANKNSLPLVTSKLNSTGGARETNGAGTIILCEAHELDVNKSKSKQQIENELKNKLSVKNVIWLKKGIPQDDNQANGPIYGNIYPNGLNGHVDEFCRFANKNTVLISALTEEEAKKHPILAEAKRRMDENYEILVNSVDQDGDKLNVIKVPFAPLFVFEEQTAKTSRIFTYVTSYLNFIVTNSFVILPSYTDNLKEFNRENYIQSEKELELIFGEVFPEREIVKVQATLLNRYGGGFHCVSINEPVAKKP